jgi:hypothetical protein
MRSFETVGNAGVFLKYEGNLIDAVISMDPDILQPPSKYYLRFSAGATGLVNGVELNGGTSTAILRVQGVVIASGTLAGGDATGVIFVTITSGVFEIDENLNTAAPATLAIARSTLLTLPKEYTYGVKSIVLQIEGAQVRLLFDGSNPTNTAANAASFGILLNPFDSYLIKGWTNCQKLRFINAVSTANATVNMMVSYGGVE